MENVENLNGSNLISYDYDLKNWWFMGKNSGFFFIKNLLN